MRSITLAKLALESSISPNISDTSKLPFALGPERQLIVLAGGSAAGKSTFALQHFKPTQVVSSDRCRALVGDSEDIQAYSPQAFELFYFIIQKRMELGKLIVSDSTALTSKVRRTLLEIAHEHDYPATIVVFTTNLNTRRKWNVLRDRRVEDFVLESHDEGFRTMLRALPQEPWDRRVFISSGNWVVEQRTKHQRQFGSIASAPIAGHKDIHNSLK